MSASITIPISTFEMIFNYEKPSFALMFDRSKVLEELFTAFAPWSPNLDEVEFLNDGKHSDRGIRIKLPSKSVQFFYGPTACRFARDAASWADYNDIEQIMSAAITTFRRVTGTSFATQTSMVSIHIVPAEVPFRDILRTALIPETFVALDATPTTVMAMVVRWAKHRVTLDASAALANGIFIQMEREHEGQATFEEIRQLIVKDQQDIFTILNVKENVPE